MFMMIVSVIGKPNGKCWSLQSITSRPLSWRRKPGFDSLVADTKEDHMTKRLNPDDLTELPEPSEIDAALEELDFSIPEQAERGHNLLWKVGFLGALAEWNRVHHKERTC